MKVSAVKKGFNPTPPPAPLLPESSTTPLLDASAAAAQRTSVLVKAGEKIVVWKRDGQAEVKAGYGLVTLGAGDTYEKLVNRIADGVSYLQVL